ncbi:kinesin-like protein KIN-14L [Gossypium arboreum]|uniref:kinesin-like protein KIN-14L n=1 Tax=Gossypium arboreum TaxID=29729 RepID=UPI0022F1792E|nr:kinesin-like protein KIN-14L [Gossypium arboreum]
MEYVTRTGFHDLNLASRKAEEAALRRYVALAWLETLVGPLGISNQPSEKEFISCLRNGLILCNVINKIHPGAVPKVVESNSHAQSLNREFQPPAAYQYFENVRNFLVAIEDLKLPAFGACDLERDNLDAGSSAKVVDCILALKSYHECKQINCGTANGYYKLTRSPMVMHSSTKINSRASSESCRRLDMPAACDKRPPANGEVYKLEDTIVKLLADYMVDTKENFDDNFLGSFHSRNPDSVKVLSKMISSCLEEQLVNKIPEGSRACTKKANQNHINLLKMQEKELSDLKDLLLTAKREFEDLQSQLQIDLKNIGSQVEEMSTAAVQYHKVVEENRKLYNMVQDLKGNIRVFCRIRPAFCAGTRNVIDFIGEDGSLVISDPSKPKKDGRKVFQFNRVFGPSATQDDVFNDTQPLVRSVMDGYNVCIFAYGQTGSGKTYTMSGPSGESTKDLGINYLALNDLFEISNQRKDIISYEIQVQMVEIYNEQIRDLLSEDSSSTKYPFLLNSLEIRSCSNDNGLSLPGATLHTVKSTSDVLNLMKYGEVNRVVCSTAINNRSSRSHSILTVHVHGKYTSGNMIRSCLHLVDLAGSERVDKSEVTGDRLKEAQHINKSLSCLGDVVTALAQKNSHIPYRNSKLTLLLQDSLGGHAKTLMFAHVSPEEDSFGETLSTLKFARRVSTVELGAARLNKESSEVMQLKEQIENLKKALANKEAPSTPSYKMKEPKSPFEKQMAAIEKTPPRTRRLSIENGSTMKSEKAMNAEDRRGPKIPSSITRARRLSSECSRNEDNSQIKVSADVSRSLHASTVSVQKYSQFQDEEALTKQFGNLSNGSSVMEAYHSKPHRSPTSSSFQKQALKTDCRTQIPRLELPSTPEPKVYSRNDIQNLMQTVISTESRTANGKGSQVRKSLRTTIGKLISGSEKRNLQKTLELKSPVRGAGNVNDLKSPPVTAHAKAARRESLTGVQTSGSDRSRRSSLGGKPIELSTPMSNNRNARTPPPVHPSSAKTTKRWL